MKKAVKTKEELLLEINELKKENEALKTICENDSSGGKPADDMIEQTDEKFKHLVWNLQIGIILQGPHAEILLCNPKALELLGITENQLLGKTSFDPDWNVIHEDGSPFPGNTHPVPQAIASNRPVINVVMGVYRPATHDRVWLLVDAIPQLNKYGKVSQVVCSFIDITKRRQAQEALLENENNLSRAEKAAKIGNWKLLLGSKEIIPSAGAKIIYGMDKDVLSLKEVREVVLPQYGNMLDEALNNLIAKGIPYNVEYKICRTSDNKIIDIHSIADYDKENKIIFGMIQDITERKHSEEELREKDRNYKLIAENTADAIWIRDMNLRIQFVSPSVSRISGYTVEEALNQDITEVMTAESIEKIQNTYKELMTNEAAGKADFDSIYTIELEQICKDGTTMWGENKVSFLRDENNQPIGFLGITRDITERKKIENELRKKTEELNNYFTYSLDLFCIANTDGYFLKLNKEWENTLGYTLEELEGIRFLDLVHPDDVESTLTTISNLSEQIPVLNFTNRYRTKKGSYRIIEWRSKPSGNLIFAAARDITERVQAESEIRQSEEKYRSLFEHMLEGFAYCKMLFENGTPQDFIYLDVNSKFEEQTGLKNVIGKKVSEVVPGIKESNPELFEIYSRVALTGNSERFESYLPTLDMWFSISVYSNQKEYFIAVFDVITERKKAEEALKESEELFRNLFAHHVAVKFLIDSDTGKIIDANDAAEKFYGWTVEQLKQMSIQNINTLNPAEIKREMEKVKSTKRSYFEFQHRLADGSIRDVEIFTSSVEAKDKTLLHSIVHDVTARKLAEAEIRRRINEITNLYETSRDLAVLPANLNELLLTIVRCAIKLLNCRDGGIYLYDKMQGDLVVAAATNPIKPVGTRVKLGQGMAGRVAQTREPMIIDDYSKWPYRLPVYEGSPLKIVIEVPMLYRNELIGVLVVEEYGETTRKFTEDDLRLLTIFAGQAAGAINSAQLFYNVQNINTQLEQKIDELHTAREEIQKNNALLKELNANKDKLFSIIAHDLKSPFQGFIGLTEIMAQDITSFSLTELSHMSKEINEYAKSLIRLIRNLLDWAQVQQGTISFNLQEIVLSESISENIDLLIKRARQKGIEIILNIPQNQIVIADESMLNSIFNNLVTNAIKFSHKGGTISISVKGTDDNMVEICISDTGIGIPNYLLKKLFKIEEKVNRNGTEGEGSTGLGLVLCKEFVEKLGGKIWAESEENIGSSFYFTLKKGHI